jgi:hypothetical protein
VKRPTHRLLVAVGALLPAACSGQGAAPGRRAPPITAVAERPATKPPATKPAAGPLGSLPNPRQLDCRSRNAWVPGEENDRFRPGRTDLAVGPLLIPGLLGWGHARPSQYGYDHRYKVGVQLRKGESATLSIPARFHRVAGLLYAERSRSASTPAEADHAVTFTSCGDHHTPFIGGFFVLDPRCVPLEVRPAGGRPVRQVVSFFAGDC